MTPFDHLVLIDGSGFVFRAFYALPPLVRPSDNAPTGAVFGFCKMLAGLKRTFDDMTHVAVVMDKSRRSWRHDIYPEYKSNRKATPDELRSQLSLIRDAVGAFGIVVSELEGYEADDLIATYAHEADQQGASVTIVSADKDMHQLIRGGITQWDPMKSQPVTVADVVRKFGVPPERAWDVQSLMGDSTDGVPGVPGIGQKTAAKLITQWGSFDGVIDNIDRIREPGVRTKLREMEHLAHISRQLTALKTDVPVVQSLNLFAHRPTNAATLDAFYRLMEFESLEAV